jgi:hypothetical protein
MAGVEWVKKMEGEGVREGRGGQSTVGTQALTLRGMEITGVPSRQGVRSEVPSGPCADEAGTARPVQRQRRVTKAWILDVRGGGL